MSLRIRRGTNSERLGVSPTPGITFDLGEIVWVTDTKKIYVGDGATVGGKNILETSVGAGLQFDNVTDQLKINESYISNLTTAITSSLFSTGQHTGITFNYGPTSISATVDFTEAQSETIRQEVINMLDQVDDDITFTYNENTGNLAASLRPERVRFYALNVFTGGNHQGISFVANEIFNNVSALVDQNWVKNLVGDMFPVSPESNVVFNYNTETKVITATVSGTLSSVSQDVSPVLGGNLDLNNFSIIGNGSILINGRLRLNPQDYELPAIVGSIASANQLDWDPIPGISTSNRSYLVWNDGTDWLPVAGYQQTNVFFVDPLRSHNYTEIGTIIAPFKTIADAIAFATDAGYNIINPAYIILLNNISEDIILSQGGIYVTGVVASDKEACVKLTGSITINSAQGSIETNQFSISNLKIFAPTNYVAIDFAGSNPQRCFVYNTKIEGEFGSQLIHHSNTEGNSELVFTDTDIISNHTNSITIEDGNLLLKRSSIKNTFANSNGINISPTSTATVIDTVFDIPIGTGRSVKGVTGSEFIYHNIMFVRQTNSMVSAYIEPTSAYINEFSPSRFYNITPQTTNISEGGVINFTITTEDVAENTMLYWKIESSDVVSSDFVENSLVGTVTIDEFGSASFTRTVASDGITQGTKTFQAILRIDSPVGEIVANSVTVTINT